MKITRENYEAFFIDYLEGKLDEKMVDTFIEFLQENPDLKEELDLFKEVSAVPETVQFSKKENLYKEKYDLESEFNKAAVARLEGDLSSDEDSQFEDYLNSHPKKKEEAVLFSRTKLKADESIRFEKKSKLYKSSGRKVFLLWAGRVAAVLVLAVAIFSVLDTSQSGTSLQQPVAEIEKAGLEKNTPAEVSKNVPEKGLVAENSQKNSVREKGKSAELNRPAKRPQSKSNEAAKKVNVREPVQESIAMRETIEVPASMYSLTASIDVPAPRARLKRIDFVYPEEAPEEEWLIADNIREKINLKKIGKAGLSFVSNLSKEHFSYETNEDGKITEVKYDSRLLGFSIPTANGRPE